MTPEERKHRIEAYLQRVEFASLEELAQHVEASTSTVRRDLTTLEAGGSLRRVIISSFTGKASTWSRRTLGPTT